MNVLQSEPEVIDFFGTHHVLIPEIIQGQGPKVTSATVPGPRSSGRPNAGLRCRVGIKGGWDQGGMFMDANGGW